MISAARWVDDKLEGTRRTERDYDKAQCPVTSICLTEPLFALEHFTVSKTASFLIPVTVGETAFTAATAGLGGIGFLSHVKNVSVLERGVSKVLLYDASAQKTAKVSRNFEGFSQYVSRRTTLSTAGDSLTLRQGRLLGETRSSLLGREASRLEAEFFSRIKGEPVLARQEMSSVRKQAQVPSSMGKRPLAITEEMGESSRALEALNLETTALEKFNKAPYHPQKIRYYLEEQYGKEAVKAHTMAVEGDPNFALAMSGKAHPETGVYFDSRLFPVFEKHVIYETRVSTQIIKEGEIMKTQSASHMREATRNLRASIEAGEINPSIFNESQLSFIMKGKEKIPGYTWHHYQDSGRIQLLDELTHKVGHKGGNVLW